MLKDIHKWSKELLFRQYLNRKGLLNTKHRQKIFIKNLLKYQYSQNKINSILNKNFQLFFNYKKENYSENFVNNNHSSLVSRIIFIDNVFLELKFYFEKTNLYF